MSRLRHFLNHSPFFIRLLHWEYWPFNLVQFPVFCYYLTLALRARSFFYFSASNPGIETGGMFGESKWKIFEIIPANLFPATILVKENTKVEEIKQQMAEKSIFYPIIAKPDRGERGWKVSKIVNESELAEYVMSMHADFLIQSYVALPVELSVFYFRYPGKDKGTISSVVVKEMLQVTGNGKSTLLQLITDYPRALLQLPVLKHSIAHQLNHVPLAGEKVELIPFGNHSRGAKFVDACHLINDELTGTFDKISAQIPGFYFGRYDLRCATIDELKQGRNFQILELNGAGAEPAHIYNPGSSLIKAYKVLFYHFRVMYEISVQNNRNGFAYMNWKEFMDIYKLLKNYRKKANAL